MRISKYIAGMVIVFGALAGCTTVVNPPGSAAPTTFNAQAVTVAGCKALAQWENDPNAIGTEGDAHTSVRVQQIIHDSAGTKFSADLTMWVDDTDTDTATTDAGVIDADCAAVGVPSVIGS